jgi:hypothetical protein
MYTVSAMGMVGLLQQNINDDIHIPTSQFLITPRYQMFTELCKRLVSSHEEMQNVRKNGTEKMVFLMQCRGVHTHVYVEYP